MRRAVMAVALLMAIGGLAALGVEVVLHRPPHDLVLKIGAGIAGGGLLLAAFLADPARMLALADRLAAFKWGRRESDTEGTPPSGGGGP